MNNEMNNNVNNLNSNGDSVINTDLNSNNINNNLENSGNSAINIDLDSNSNLNNNINTVDTNNVTNINPVVDNSVTSNNVNTIYTNNITNNVDSNNANTVGATNNINTSNLENNVKSAVNTSVNSNNVNSANINNTTSSNQTVNSSTNNNYKNPYANSNIIVNNPYDNVYNNQNNNSSESTNNTYTEEVSTNYEVPRKKTNKLVVTIVIIAIIVGLVMIFGFVKSVFDNMDAIDQSKASAWDNTVKLLKSDMKSAFNILDPTTGESKYSVDKLCSDTSKLKEVLYYDDDMSITCNLSENKYTFTAKGIKQFDGYSSKIICSKEKSYTSCVINQN